MLVRINKNDAHPRREDDDIMKSEDKTIGYCGYNCHLCAARSDDINVRRKLVNAWRKYLGHQYYTAENVACEGCKSEGN
jgi:hypothetical protein